MTAKKTLVSQYSDIVLSLDFHFPYYDIESVEHSIHFFRCSDILLLPLKVFHNTYKNYP